MAIGATNYQVTHSANFIPEIWMNETIADYKANLVMGNLVRKISHKGQKGDTIHIPNYTRQTATAKAADTEITPKAVTHSVTNISLDKHYYNSALIEDIIKLQANTSLRSAITEDFGYSLAKQTDSDIHAQFETLNGGAAVGANNWETAVIGGDGTTAFNDATVGNGTDITDAGIRAMILQLDDADVPMSMRYMVIPPICKSDLLALPRFTEQAFIGDGANPIRNGKLGSIYGMDVYVSSNCPSFASDDFSTLYRAGHIFHKDAVVWAEQQGVRVQAQNKLEHLGELLVADCVYGVAEYRDNAGVSFIVPAA